MILDTLTAIEVVEIDNWIYLLRLKLVSTELSEKKYHSKGESYSYEPLEDLRFLLKGKKKRFQFFYR